MPIALNWNSYISPFAAKKRNDLERNRHHSILAFFPIESKTPCSITSLYTKKGFVYVWRWQMIPQTNMLKSNIFLRTSCYVYHSDWNVALASSHLQVRAQQLAKSCSFPFTMEKDANHKICRLFITLLIKHAIKDAIKDTIYKIHKILNTELSCWSNFVRGTNWCLFRFVTAGLVVELEDIESRRPMSPLLKALSTEQKTWLVKIFGTTEL